MSEKENEVGIPGIVEYSDGTKDLSHNVADLIELSRYAAERGNTGVLLEIITHMGDMVLKLREQVDFYESDVSEPILSRIPENCGVYKFCYGGEDFEYNPDSGKVSNAYGNIVTLARRRNWILYHLASNPGSVSRNESLYEWLWPDDRSESCDANLKVLVSHMRKDLNQVSPGLGKSIETLRAVGYAWNIESIEKIDSEK